MLVIGGNAAGMSAASRVARYSKDFEVLVFDASEFVSYGMCGMPYLFSKEVESVEKLFALSEKEVLERGIDLRKNEEAIELMPGRKRVKFRNKRSGIIKEEYYDYLVIATGSIPRRIDIPYFEGENLFTLHTLNDAVRIKEFIEKYNPYSVTIIGNGFVGLEMAETLSKRGLKVNLIGKRVNFLKKLNRDFSLKLCQFLMEKGIRVFLEVEILGVKKEGDIIKSLSTNNGEVQSDFYLYSVGVKPATQFLKGSQISLGIEDAIVVDEKCRTNLHNVFAAGDCCAVKNLITGKYRYIPLGTTANKMGKVAGSNILGEREEFLGVLGTSIIRVFDYEIGMTGLTLEEAKGEGISALEVVVESSARAKYLKDKGDVFVNIVAEKGGGKILGGQVMGSYGTKGRIDTVATMIYGKMRVCETKYLDLCYSPPFSPVWDPLLIALDRLSKKT